MSPAAASKYPSDGLSRSASRLLSAVPIDSIESFASSTVNVLPGSRRLGVERDLRQTGKLPDRFAGNVLAVTSLIQLRHLVERDGEVRKVERMPVNRVTRLPICRKLRFVSLEAAEAEQEVEALEEK